MLLPRPLISAKRRLWSRGEWAGRKREQRRRGAKERGRRQSRHNKLLGYDLENICQLQVVFVTQKEKEGVRERDRERKCAAEKGISR